MVQFDDERRTLPRFDIPMTVPETESSHKDIGTGAAWSSSVRGVSCSLKWGNERNPRSVLYVSRKTIPALCALRKGKFQKLVIPFVRLRTKGRGGSGDDARSAWPLRLGLHTCYNGEDKGTPTRKGEQIPKTSPQFRLGAATRPHEVGIASNRGSAMPR